MLCVCVHVHYVHNTADGFRICPSFCLLAVCFCSLGDVLQLFLSSCFSLTVEDKFKKGREDKGMQRKGADNRIKPQPLGPRGLDLNESKAFGCVLATCFKHGVSKILAQLKLCKCVISAEICWCTFPSSEFSTTDVTHQLIISELEGVSAVKNARLCSVGVR